MYWLKPPQKSNEGLSVDTIPLKRQQALTGPERRPKLPQLSMKMNPKGWGKAFLLHTCILAQKVINTRCLKEVDQPSF